VREVVQAKRHRGTIERKDLDALCGSLYRFDAVRATIIATSRFSKGTEEAALANGAAIILIDGDKLIDLLIAHGIRAAADLLVGLAVKLPVATASTLPVATAVKLPVAMPATLPVAMAVEMPVAGSAARTLVAPGLRLAAAAQLRATAAPAISD
jgi:hypothetical protein